MPEKIISSGLEATYVAVTAAGLEVANSGSVFIHAKASAADTLTIVTPYQADGLELADRTIEMGIGDEIFVGPFSRTLYNDPAGNMTIKSTNEAITAAALTL